MSEHKRTLKFFLCLAHMRTVTPCADPAGTRLTKYGVDALLDKAKLPSGQDCELEICEVVRKIINV